MTSRGAFQFPFVVDIEPDDEGYIVSSVYPTVHGDGDTLFEALQDYAQSLLEWCEIVSR